ncbi:META domain-containing protein [Elizabethkingia miricola]|uniref:META domain-containing protein n=1 Tax=Elizabethkingia bruuniana TaxID=1756149 RepID=UPI000999B404|nr:META domain-containing protein [Elizabethkingia bruuniana]OPC58798.1 META domain-containing protein [Elizabethkingia bruuniana]OPC64229.1 META domain-containing protein [Elizabethkingia bruuniana]RBI92976.1 META domain-containing protein [Elizabethkingia miricola]
MFLFALIAAGILLVTNSCTTVTKTDSSSTQTTTENTIIGKKWKLVELFRKPVADQINGKEAFLKLLQQDKAYLYQASGGCNGIRGTFTTNTTTSVIHFSPGASTRMVCPDMSVEAEINKVLETVDNYSLNKEGNILSLNKARMAP